MSKEEWNDTDKDVLSSITVKSALASEHVRNLR